MRTPTTIATIRESMEPPMSGVRSSSGEQWHRGNQMRVIVRPTAEQSCCYCGVREELLWDPYGQILCTECAERATADPWFDVGGG